MREPAEVGAQLLDDPERVGLGQTLEQHPELLAAVAAQHVGVTQPPPQQRGEGDQHAVADRVSEVVVDRLEAVEVQHHQRGPELGPAAGALVGVLGLLQERGVGHQPGQPIALHQAAQEPRALEMRRDGRQQQRRVHGLDQEVVAAGPQPLDPRFGLGFGRQEHDRQRSEARVLA